MKLYNSDVHYTTAPKYDTSLFQNALGFSLKNTTTLLQNAAVIRNWEEFFTNCDSIINKSKVWTKSTDPKFCMADWQR